MIDLIIQYWVQILIFVVVTEIVFLLLCKDFSMEEDDSVLSIIVNKLMSMVVGGIFLLLYYAIKILLEIVPKEILNNWFIGFIFLLSFVMLNILGVVYFKK